MENEISGRMPPGILFRSFLVVGSGYCTSLLLFIASIWGVSKLFFPEIHAILGDQEHLEQVMENTPEEFFTRPFFWALLVTNLLGNVVVGWLSYRVAPFAKFPHAVFVAITILISFLQQSLSQGQSIQWMFTLMMVAFPLAIMLGAQLGVWQCTPREELPLDAD